MKDIPYYIEKSIHVPGIMLKPKNVAGKTSMTRHKNKNK